MACLQLDLAGRARVVAYRREAEPAHDGKSEWATQMRRAFGYELLVCAGCGGKMMSLSVVMRRDVVDRILARAGPLE